MMGQKGISMNKIILVLGLTLLSCVTIPYIEGVKDITSDTPPQEILEWLNSGAETDALENPGFPIVQGQTLTFVYFNPEARQVALDTELNTSSAEDYLRPYQDTGLFWKTLELDNLSPFEYRFRVVLKDGTLLRLKDPLNPLVPPYNIRISYFQNPAEKRGRILGLPKLKAQEGSVAKDRFLWVYLPLAYYEDPQQRFPVFYFMDGQNLWTHQELPYNGWRLDSTLDTLIAAKEIPPMIIVGVPNSSKRNPEYMGNTTFYGSENPKNPKLQAENIQRAKDFQAYMVETIKPYIDAELRTLPDQANTFIGGSSFGAGVSVQLFINYPQVFSKLLAMSLGQYHPVLATSQWNQKPFNLLGWVKDNPPALIPGARIYMDCGTVSVDEIFAPHGEQIHKLFLEAGYSQEDCRWVLDPGGEHNEAAWARRMPEALRFLFP
jgi:enterochelin esterase-like enzyme